MLDERWGDWRPHLAMILANHSCRPELDKKSMITLGDTLGQLSTLFDVTLSGLSYLSWPRWPSG